MHVDEPVREQLGGVLPGRRLSALQKVGQRLERLVRHGEQLFEFQSVQPEGDDGLGP